MSKLCPQCGAPVQENAKKCEYCGAAIVEEKVEAPVNNAQPQVVYVQQPSANNERANWPIKNKIVAGILAILLGGIGVHKFYLGKIGQGVVYILFCWTYIPAIIGLIEGIIILCSNDENFELKYHCRIG